jgi:ribosomal protein S1
MNKFQINQNSKKPSWWHVLRLPNINMKVIIEGLVIAKTDQSLYVDLGEIGVGIVWGKEFLLASKAIEPLKIGDKIKVKIVGLDNGQGIVELSLQEVSREAGLKKIKDLIQTNETITGKVLSVNRGGLIIQVNNFQGFLPTSQMSRKNFPKVDDGDKEKILEELSKFIGKEISVKILNFILDENKIIFSEKKIEDEKNKKIIEEKYKIGDVISGTIERVKQGEVIFRIEGEESIRGFIPFSEISWKENENISDIIKLGDKKQAKIIGFRDSELKLSLKEMKEDFWIAVLKKYEIGQVVSGKIFKFISLGALAEIEDGVYGFIHSSELGGLEEMEKKLKLGEKYDFVVKAIKKEERRFDLKLK